MLRIISSHFKYSQFYDEDYRVRPGQFGSQDEAETHMHENAMKLHVKGSLRGQEVDGGNDVYFDIGEAIGIAESVVMEFFPSGDMDYVWVEDDLGNIVWDKRAGSPAI